MGIRITSNLIGANSALNVNRTYGSLLKTAEKLSSGLRINRAADDPAGLVISEQLRARIASLNQEIENTTFAISKYRTADSTVMELRSMLQDIRSDAVAAANGGFNDPASQAALDDSARNAAAAYNNVIETAEFNGGKLLDGSEQSLADLSPLEGIDLSSPEKAAESIDKIDRAMAELDAAQVEIGATQKNELEARRSNLEVTRQNLISAESQIRDADIPLEISKFLSGQIKLRAGIAVMAHANLIHKNVFSILGG
jgi:flagellin